MKFFISALVILLGFQYSLAKDVKPIYERSCKMCHGNKYPNSPQVGDKKAWDQRLKAAGGKIENLIATVKKGKGTMPPKGLCNDCTDEDYRALILFMGGFKDEKTKKDKKK